MNDNLREIEKPNFVEDIDRKYGKYTGYVNEYNQPQGKGKYTYNNGDVYEGEFKDGNFNGKGKKTYADSSYEDWSVYEPADPRRVYEGEFKDNAYNGKGKLTYKNGDVYEGEFRKGLFDGKGKKTYNNGDVYEGEFRYDKPHGKGKFTYENGTVLEGAFVRGLKNGRFLVTSPRDSPIIHNYENGELRSKHDLNFVEKKFIYLYARVHGGNSVDYTGYVNENGEPHGKGKFTYENGTVLEGEFKDGNFNGKGKIIYGNGSLNSPYENGDVYEGEFKEFNKDNKPHGKGKFIYKNGTVYEGEFKDGKKHGRFLITFPNGYKKKQRFEFSMPTSYDVPIKKNQIFVEDINNWKSSKYLGKYTGYVNEYNQPHGKGILTYNNGHVYEGEFKHNLKHGIFLVTFPNGYKKKIWYKNDQIIYSRPIKKNQIIVGDINWNPKNRMPFAPPHSGSEYLGKYTGYVNEYNKPHGKGILTHIRGDVYEGEFKHNVKHGIFLVTSRNGDKQKIKYKNDKIIYERPIKKKPEQQTRGGRKLKNKKTKRKKINKKGKTHKKKKNKRKTKNKI